MNAFELEIMASHAVRVDEGRFMLCTLFDMKVMRLCSSAVVQKCQLQDYNMATSLFLLTMKTIAWCGSGEPRTSILDSP